MVSKGLIKALATLGGIFHTISTLTVTVDISLNSSEEIVTEQFDIFISFGLNF